MANKEQVKRLLSGVEKWNVWLEGVRWKTRINLIGANLRGAGLSGANLSSISLSGTNLSGANLYDANLSGTNLVGADLIGADLGGANLSGANLNDANLSGANLYDADLDSAELRRANLNDADLSYANLTRADLYDVKLHGATLGYAVLGSLDLSGVLGLAEVKHPGPSTIGADTLELTAAGLETAPPERRGEVETFLRGAGVPEHYLEMFRSRIGMPIEFYSAFISYSHADKPFAQRLYADLQARGIRCWLDEKDGRIGDPIYEAVNQAIRSNDRVILCCSFASLTSKWVDKELTMTFDKEDRSGQPILLPLDLDGALFDWESAKAVMVRERIAARFKGWDTDARLYEERLERVVEAMRPRGDHDGE